MSDPFEVAVERLFTLMDQTRTSSLGVGVCDCACCRRPARPMPHTSYARDAALAVPQEVTA